MWAAPNGCWLYENTLDGRHGDGWYHGETFKVHVKAYEIWKGPIPEGLIVRHKCDIARCINPAHLELGTKKDNRQDFMKRNPRAMELCLAAAKIGGKGTKRFWDKLNPEERAAFIQKRVETQKQKRIDRLHARIAAHRKEQENRNAPLCT
jgi:hypothetical protein